MTDLVTPLAAGSGSSAAFVAIVIVVGVLLLTSGSKRRAEQRRLRARLSPADRKQLRRIESAARRFHGDRTQLWSMFARFGGDAKVFRGPAAKAHATYKAGKPK